MKMLAFILHLKFLENKSILKLYFALLCSSYFVFKLNLYNYIKKCPECYGTDLCIFFQNRQIQLTWYSALLSILNPNLTKSVFFGIFNETEIVVKRKSVRAVGRTNFNNIKLNNDEIPNVILCPSIKDSQFLFNQIQNGIEKKRLWLDIRTSIEPLLLMYFQSEETWPFPKYYGACGDLIVEEYKGEPLANFLFSNFEKRIFLAVHLLEMANLFTFGHSKLAFYFTDYSLYNFVVDSSGKVSLIDFDNVIISNRSALGNYSSSGTVHSSEILDDQNYAFSPFDICGHYLSDHNYFSICKYLLSHSEDGLLKVIPSDFNKHRELMWLLSECSQPKAMTNRFFAGQKLQSFLKSINGNYSCVKQAQCTQERYGLKPVVSSDLNCQVDLIDLQSNKDGEYKLVIVCLDK